MTGVGGESYRPADRPGRSPSRGYDARHRRSPPRNRSRLRGDTWLPSTRGYGRPRSRSPPDYRRRSRTPPFQGRGFGPGSYGRRRSPPRRFSPRREDRPRSPLPSWRSKSPYSEGRSRDVSRGRSSPRRNRDASPGSQDLRPIRRTTPPKGPTGERSIRAVSPRAQVTPTLRPQSPSHTLPRRDLPPDLSRARPFSQSRPVSPVHVARPDSSTTSRRSSPVTGPDRRPAASRKSRSRSPIRSSPRRPSGLSGAQFYRDRDSTRHPEAIHSERGPSNADRPESELSEPVQSRSGSHIPTQPRNTGIRQSPPSGPSHGPKTIPSQPRSSHNTSFLSAPTRPRRGPPGSRDGPWPSAPMARRGPSMTAPHPTPSGPRASFTPPVPGGNFRHPGSRQNSTAPVVSSSPVSKPPNHLVGLYTLIPGGRTLPSALDGATEKRLSQLESDQEKLLEQMAESQRLKRAGLRDWDRLDHESSICALKSDLAEGHLQRMADEAIGGGIPF